MAEFFASFKKSIIHFEICGEADVNFLSQRKVKNV